MYRVIECVKEEPINSPDPTYLITARDLQGGMSFVGYMHFPEEIGTYLFIERSIEGATSITSQTTMQVLEWRRRIGK